MICAGAPGKNKRPLSSVRSQQRQPGKVDHINNGRIAHFILQRKADKIHLHKRRFGLQCHQRHLFLPHQRFHISCRCKNTLAIDIFLFVQLMVQDLQSEVRHADLIKIRESKREPRIDLLQILLCREKLSADIASGFFHTL